MAMFGLASLPSPAGAEPRTITVTLLGGETISITLDVPPGTPLDQIVLPPIDTPILTVTDHGAAPQPPAPVPKPGAAAPADAARKAPARTKTKRARKGARRHTPAAVTQTAAAKRVRVQRRATPKRAADGTPRLADPTYTYAIPGPAPVGVPNFFIDKFRIPPFLLPIYQAAGIEYGIRWEILAAINEIETDYGRNLNVSSAGALGWMQFMPATWKRYGTDANNDRKRDPYNPVDAIFAAARYLKAAGAQQDIRKAIFAYNHADWYVDSVLMRARLIGGTPADLVGSLTGLTQGRFPVAATARYAQGKRATNIFARAGAAVVAVQDAKVVRIGRSEKLGRFVRVRDAFGNTYTYARLARVARTYTVAPTRRATKVAALPSATPTAGPAAAPLSLHRGAAAALPVKELVAANLSSLRSLPVKESIAANPSATSVTSDARTGRVKRLRVGSRVAGGTVLGRIGDSGDNTAPHVKFMIRPGGKGAPLIDPKPILDGWKLLESTAIYRAKSLNPLLGKNPTIGQILLMSKAQLQRRVLADPRIEVYDGGRDDIRSDQIDRRVLATLEFLAASGLKPTVSSLKGNHGLYTASGNISEHASGNAVDIAKINGIPIIGHQGSGSITDITVRRLLTLQGTIKPHQIISLMSYDGTDNAIALPDHADHIHVGFRPDAVTVLKPLQWTRLIDRLGRIDNPDVLG